MIDKKELSEALGLSCVENYFLAWLNERYEVKKLYGNSFVSAGQVFDDFSRGATYENYCHIPRLQDIAEDYGIVKHKYLPCGSKAALEAIRSQNTDELCLVRVNTRFFLNRKRASWREDHYICVDKDLRWINEYPLSEGAFTEEGFSEVYDGGLCIYSFGDLTAEPADECTEKIRRQSFETLPKIGLQRYEGAVGILRITRKRLRGYYSENEEVEKVLKEEIPLLNKLYFKARMKQIKQLKCGREEHFSTEEEMREIVEYEKKLKEAMK